MIIIKFDIPVPCFYGGMDFCEAIDRIAAGGFDKIETYDRKSLDISAVKEALKRNNVELISMCTSFFNMTDSRYRQTWLENLDESCADAVKLGVGKLITQVGNDTGDERALQHENIVKTLQLAKPVLEKYGVTVMIEPLNVLVDHKGYYLTSSAEAFEIVRETGSEYVKVVYDIYHQQITEGNIIPNIVNNLDCIAHLHCAGHPGRHDLQFGENDYKVIFSAVDKAGYTGCCGLEYTPITDAETSLNEFKRIYMA